MGFCHAWVKAKDACNMLRRKCLIALEQEAKYFQRIVMEPALLLGERLYLRAEILYLLAERFRLRRILSKRREAIAKFERKRFHDICARMAKDGVIDRLNNLVGSFECAHEGYPVEEPNDEN